MAIILTKREFEELPEVDQWAIVYNLEPKTESLPEPPPKPEASPPKVQPTVEGFWN